VKALETDLAGVLILEPVVYSDDRGFFFESFNQAEFEQETGIVRDWVQDNHSKSSRGVLRGMHFQNPNPQGKLVRCITGSVWDVAVDLRRSSDTFAQWAGVELSSVNQRQLWVPEGFAHGFLTLSDVAEVLYRTTTYYEPKHDHSLRWDDPTVGIEWPLDGDPVLSPKDRDAPLLDGVDTFG
jgi:dTDP-4-dehydrorhamnose 3,5-epimerase